MPGEIAADECLSGLDRFKSETLITVLDEAYQQMCSRFQQQNIMFMQQLSLFTPKSLISDKSVTSSEIENICQLYGVNCDEVAAELADFKRTFRMLSETGADDCPLSQANHDVSEGLTLQPPSDSEPETDDQDIGECDNNNKDSAPDNNVNYAWHWQQHAFMKPLKLLSQLSGYPNLLMLYSIFSCLAVSSAFS